MAVRFLQTLVGWGAGVSDRLDTGVFSEQSAGRTQLYVGWRGPKLFGVRRGVFLTRPYAPPRPQG